MKKRAGVSAAMTLSMLLLATPAKTTESQQQNATLLSTSFPIAIAHRANGCGFGRENSWNAIEDCVEKNVTGIEIDIRYTSDHIPILHHDPTIRLNDGHTYAVQELTLAQIQKKRTGRYEIATLQDVLSTFEGKTLFDLDLKEKNVGPTIEIIVATKAFSSSYIRLSKPEHYQGMAAYQTQYPALQIMPRIWERKHFDEAIANGVTFSIAEVSADAPEELLNLLRQHNVRAQSYVRFSYLFPCQKYLKQVERGVSIVQVDTPLWVRSCER